MPKLIVIYLLELTINDGGRSTKTAHCDSDDLVIVRGVANYYINLTPLEMDLCSMVTFVGNKLVNPFLKKEFADPFENHNGYYISIHSDSFGTARDFAAGKRKLYGNTTWKIQTPHIPKTRRATLERGRMILKKIVNFGVASKSV